MQVNALAIVNICIKTKLQLAVNIAAQRNANTSRLLTVK
jgi:hypothetical protein